jgi:hypothetical protein
VVLDIDTKNGATGLSWLEQLPFKLPATLVRTSRHDGLHFYFKISDTQKSKLTKKRYGIKNAVDFIVQGAVFESGSKLGTDDEVCDLPDVLLDFILNDQNKRSTQGEKEEKPVFRNADPTIELFNKKDPSEYLVSAGWKINKITDRKGYKDSQLVSTWTRPDKPRGVSATLSKDNAGNYWFYSFSSSSKLQTSKWYTSFGLIKELKFGNDFSSAKQFARNNV